MVIVEEYHGQESKRDCHKYPFHVKVPKINQPPPRLSWIKSSGNWQLSNIC